MGFRTYTPNADVKEHIEKINLYIKLHDFRGSVRATALTNYHGVSDRPFHLSYYDEKGVYRTICYTSPEKLEAGVQRLLEKTQ